MSPLNLLVVLSCVLALVAAQYDTHRSYGGVSSGYGRGGYIRNGYDNSYDRGYDNGYNRGYDNDGYRGSSGRRYGSRFGSRRASYVRDNYRRGGYGSRRIYYN